MAELGGSVRLFVLQGEGSKNNKSKGFVDWIPGGRMIIQWDKLGGHHRHPARGIGPADIAIFNRSCSQSPPAFVAA